MVQAYALSWAVIGAVMIGINYTQFRNLPITEYKPAAAWTRAMIYFAFCNIVSALSGTLDVILSQPIATAEQLQDPVWIAACVFCFSYIFVAYWILWSRMTLTFDRKFYLGSEIVFGLLWGASMGQLLLTFYHVFQLTDLPAWAVYLAAYSCMGVWQYFIQDYWWDCYISPEHDDPRSIKLKTFICHIPNVAICLAFLVYYNNYLIYVATQTFGLIAATIFQRFPAPWAKGEFHAPMVKPGLFGFPHGAGYVVEEAQS